MIATRKRPRRSGPWLLIVALLCSPATAFELEMNAVTVNDTFAVPSWTSVSFMQPFDTPPLVFALPTADGGDPATLRIRNVTTSGFEIVQTEASADDGPHVAMTTAYIAIEPGSHTLPGGTRLIAFEHSTTSFANRLLATTWDSVFFPTPFASAPTVLGSIQTVANESGSPPATASVPFMDVGIRNVTAGALQVTLERAESTAGSVTSPERIAILAIDNLANVSFVDAFGTAVLLQSLTTPTNIAGWSNGCYPNSYPASFAGVPLAVASAVTRIGNNGGWLRRCSQSASSLGLTVDEDTDNDSERSHTSEAAGIVAASVAFHANFDVDLGIVKSVDALSDPVNGTSNQRAIPDGVVGYTISVQNRGSLSPDLDTLAVEDTIPNELSLCVSSACLAGGPVLIDSSGSPVPPGVSLGSIEYSNDGGSSFGYVPSPDAAGFDAAVNAVRINLDGVLSPIATLGVPEFDLVLAARIN